MTTGGKAFIDTNVLLRAMNVSMQLHVKAEALVQQMWEADVELWVSRQVIREYIAQVTRPQVLAQIPTPKEIRAQVEQIQSLFRVADEAEDVTLKLVTLLEKYPTAGRQIHDANIVATMLVNGIDRLLTANIADFKRFNPEIVLIPLVENG